MLIAYCLSQMPWQQAFVRGVLHNSGKFVSEWEGKEQYNKIVQKPLQNQSLAHAAQISGFLVILLVCDHKSIFKAV